MSKLDRERYNNRYEKNEVEHQIEEILNYERHQEMEQRDEKIQHEQRVLNRIRSIISSEGSWTLNVKSIFFVKLSILEWDEYTWILVSVNNYYRDIQAYPGEIAIAQFSLKRGIIKTVNIVSATSV